MKIPSQYTLEQVQHSISVIKHCQILDLKAVEVFKGTLTLELPYSKSLIGNPDTGVIHGGAISTLLDTTCGLSVAGSFDEFEICPTLDLRIDYMGAAKPNFSIYAYAEVYRSTDNVVFCRGKAYQQNINQPVAHCVATFMRLPKPEMNMTNEQQQ